MTKQGLEFLVEKYAEPMASEQPNDAQPVAATFPMPPALADFAHQAAELSLKSVAVQVSIQKDKPATN